MCELFVYTLAIFETLYAIWFFVSFAMAIPSLTELPGEWQDRMEADERKKKRLTL